MEGYRERVKGGLREGAKTPGVVLWGALTGLAFRVKGVVAPSNKAAGSILAGSILKPSYTSYTFY